MIKFESKTTTLTFSAIVIAMYITVMYVTQSFAFGAYQIRLATSLYALAYLFPFLIVPLGLSNFLSNFVLFWPKGVARKRIPLLKASLFISL